MLGLDLFQLSAPALPEGWYGEGRGMRVQVGKHMYTCSRFILIYGKNQYNIVKLKKLNRIKIKTNKQTKRNLYGRKISLLGEQSKKAE